ncbi:MAG: hypothetical protein E7205_09195 [Tissierellaceae bacterium]|nr:hypothetical protein [Tissierellaceae bacterium]
MDRFWNDFSSIERWPEILINLPEKMESKSKYDIAKNYLSYPTDDRGRVLRSDEFYGLFGAEIKQEKIIISGCNLIQLNDEGYFLSEEALKLRVCYERDEGWEKELAKQLLKYSIRVRAVIIGILNGGGIQFPRKFLYKNREAYIDMKENRFFLLNPTIAVTNLNDFLKNYGKESLGPYWKDILNIDNEEDIEILGTTKDYPSLSDIGTYLKIPLTLFEYLGWFIDKGEGKYQINKELLKKDIGSDIYESLIIEDFLNDVDILKDLINQYQDVRGLFPIEQVGEALKLMIAPEVNENSGKWIDRYFLEGAEKGKFRIVDYEQGQPRHGRGLLGDNKKQLIKIEF